MNEFLEQVITTKEGYFCLSTLRDKDWVDYWFDWPKQSEEVQAVADRFGNERSVYFSAHLFSEKKATYEAVLTSRTIQADLDYGVAPTQLQPTVLVCTSPERHQGYWILAQEPASIEELSNLSRSLTYSIPYCDKACWQLGHRMRFPGTHNFKYPQAPEVKVVSSSLIPYRNLPIPRLTALMRKRAEDEEKWEPQGIDVGPLRLLQEVKSSIPARLYTQYNKRQADRSAYLWALMLTLFRAGLDRDQVFYLAFNSANNKFAENRYNGERDLRRDVLRAEGEANKNSGTSVLQQLKAVDESSGNVNDKNMLRARIIHENMETMGTFLSTDEGEFFVRKDTGRPIALTKHSPWLDSYIETCYEINATQNTQRYITAFLESRTKELGRKAVTARLSYYNYVTNTVLLHTGYRDVLVVGPRGIQTIQNGQYDLLFHWSAQSETFEPDLRNPLGVDYMIKDAFDNVVGMEPEQAKALFKTWFYYLFFKELVISRPILALFGQPGSGKTTLLRRIYRVLYGKYKGVNSATSPEEFDHAVSKDPFVAFDQMDASFGWLPDKLALSAAVSDLEKRRLYTDNDTVVVRRQALIALSCVTPRFRREDIVDRLIMLTFQRLDSWKSDTAILEDIENHRDQIWGGIVKDLQVVLGSPFPREDEVPTFRINDFAKLGLWISRALGYEELFRSALAQNVKRQVSLNVEEDSVLIEAINKWLDRDASRGNRYYKVNDLYEQLAIAGPEEFTTQFPRSTTLGRKLWIMQDTLKSMFSIDFKEGTQREWRISHGS